MTITVDDCTHLLHDLVAINSINPDLVPGAPGEGEIAQFVAAWMQRAGLEVTIEEAAPGRSNVVGVARGTGGGRSLLLNAHTDTVGVTGMDAPHAPVVRDGKLYGRGAYDMKGGLAAALLAVQAAKAQRLRGDVIVAAVCDEEYASVGTDALVQRWQADAAIVTEPTELQLCVAHKGFVWLEVETHGVPAHGSRPDLGVDAIAQMGAVLVALAKHDRALRRNPAHPLLGAGSLHASLISGGQELSSYPERCVLSIERRTVPGETPEAVTVDIQAILDQLAADDETFNATLRTTFSRASFSVGNDAPILMELQRQASALLGYPPHIIGAPFWMDSAILAAAGIPTVIFGPTGAGAHAATEWVDLASVAQCADVLLATAAAFCK